MVQRTVLALPPKGEVVVAVEERSGVTLIEVNPTKIAETLSYRRVLQAFPRYSALVMGDSVHAHLVRVFTEYLNEQHRACGAGPIDAEERWCLNSESVSLFHDHDQFVIRPDVIAHALDADIMLQRLTRPEDIVFLGAEEELKRLGMLWRCTPEPITDGEIINFIKACRARVATDSWYFHNRYTGTRYMTVEDLADIRNALDCKPRFLERIVEAYELLTRENRLAVSELALFQLDGPPPLDLLSLLAVHEGDVWEAGEAEECAALFDRLVQGVRTATPIPYRNNDYHCEDWVDEMFGALTARSSRGRYDAEHAMGIGAVFHHHIAWLPGAVIHNGALVIDARARDVVRGLIRCYADMFTGLEYINIGSIQHSRSGRETVDREEREVYVVALKQRHEVEKLCIVRKQKWGVSTHRYNGKSPQQAQDYAAEYTQYIADRLAGMKALGLDIPDFSHFILEYAAEGQATVRESFWRRPYVHGVASDKIPAGYLCNPAFRACMARLLGKAAGANLVIGREDALGRLLFNDGDEIVLFSNVGLPERIMLCETTGAFANYLQPLPDQCDAYERKLARFLAGCEEGGASRDELGDLRRAFVASLHREFVEIRDRYRQDAERLWHLFDHRPYDPNGSYLCRWQHVLERLDGGDIDALVRALDPELVPA